MSINISHLSILGINELRTIIDTTEDTIKETINISVDTTIRTDKDLIIIGFGDGGLDLSNKIDDIITVHNAGIPVLFLHDTPKTSDYSETLSSIGIIGVDHSFEYNMFNNLNKNILNHKVLTSYFDLSNTPLKSQNTHNVGLELSLDCNIVLNNNNIVNSNKNFYLACLEQISKGKIAYMALGHNEYSNTTLYDVPVTEVSLLINTIAWLVNL